MRKYRRNTFEVFASRDCIDNSERNSLSWCIFALAIVYSIQGAQKVQVDKSETRFTYRGFRYVFPTPEKSARIAQSYDNGFLTKQEISPWHDTLKDAISIEPSRHTRPAKNKTKKKKTAKKRNNNNNCSTTRSNRWGGRRI